jgi:hypothetical protein
MLVTKVFDLNCPVCEAMGAYDKTVVSEFDLKAEAVNLDTLLNLNNENAFECMIAQYVEQYACNADYTLDLPAYIITEGKKYVGHIVGEQTAKELKEKLAEIIDGSNQKDQNVSSFGG